MRVISKSKCNFQFIEIIIRKLLHTMMLVLAGLIDVKVFILKKIGVGCWPTSYLSSLYAHEALIPPHQQFHNQADNSV